MGQILASLVREYIRHLASDWPQILVVAATALLVIWIVESQYRSSTNFALAPATPETTATTIILVTLSISAACSISRALERRKSRKDSAGKVTP